MSTTSFHGHALTTVLCVSAALTGCSMTDHDAKLDQKQTHKDKPLAESTAKQQAISDLACEQITTTILSRKNVEGAPLGPVWSNYTIATQGCGKSATYLITCKGTYRPYCYEKKP
jgi:hypothetical protein